MALSDIWQVFNVSGNITLSLAVATVAFVAYFIYVHFRSVDNWEKYGVRSGTLGKEAFTDFRLAVHLLLKEHDTVGTSSGQMFLFTRDLDLLRMIMVKDFNNFSDREVFVETNSPIIKGLVFLGGNDWKRIRHVISPCFSTGKIKSFLTPVNDSARKLSQVIEDYAKRNELVPIKHLGGQFTSETIARLAFGVRTDCIGKEDDEFTHFSKTLVKVRSSIGRLVMLLMFRFRGLHKFLVEKLKINFLDEVDRAADVYFNNILHRTIAERKEYVRLGKKLHQDFLQSLVIAKEEGDRAVAAATNSGDVGSSVKKGDDSNTINTMSDEELIGQAMLIVFAGFETTSTTLQFVFYLLAKHPDVQEKVYEEIKKVVLSDVPTYEELGELKYMDQVISETLRLFPPAPLMNRKAQKNITYGNMTIPKGTPIIVPFDMVMMDPRHYENPEKFDPDRFSDENKARRDPMTFLPFGYGPRLCIGMRLAQLELKVVLVNVMRGVKFGLNERTEPTIGGEVDVKYQGFIVADNPIMLDAELRN